MTESISVSISISDSYSYSSQFKPPVLLFSPSPLLSSLHSPLLRIPRLTASQTAMSTSTSPTQELKDGIKTIETKPAEAKPVNQTIAQLRSLAAGAAGGLCAVVVGHPFDLVKVRLQTAEKGVYASAMDVVRKTVAREGLARVGLTFGHCVAEQELTGTLGRVCTPVYLPR